MKQSAYQHRTAVDEARGRFEYDCSGFVTYALRRTLPEVAAEVRAAAGRRPLAEDYFALVDSAHPRRADSHLRPIARVHDLRPGDLIAWLRPPDKASKDTGHLMVVLSAPTRSPDRPDELLIAVADSSKTPHAADSRAPGTTGLGRGTLGLIVDREGRPLRYRWRGGLSRNAVATAIALGRVE